MWWSYLTMCFEMILNRLRKSHLIIVYWMKDTLFETQKQRLPKQPRKYEPTTDSFSAELQYKYESFAFLLESIKRRSTNHFAWVGLE